MSNTHGNISLNVKRGSGRMTRAGNDMDAFPFEKLSVDGAALAKMIISPLPNPSFASNRVRDPLKGRDSRDSTSSTVNTSDEDVTSRKKKTSAKKGGSKKKVKENNNNNNNNTNNEDQYYDVEPSLSVRRVVSPPTNGTKSVAFSTLNATSGMKMTDLPEQLDITELDMTEETVSSPSNTKNHNSSPDPEAKHGSRIFRRSESDIRESDEYVESDSYYEVLDSPRVDNNNETSYRASNHTYYSEALSTTGWETCTGGSSADDPPPATTKYSQRTFSDDISDDTPPSPRKSHRTFSIDPPPSPRKGSPPSKSSFSKESSDSAGRSGRVCADGRVYVSPNHKKKLLSEQNLLQHGEGIPIAKFSSQERGRAIDPDGEIDLGVTHSDHGENINPTPDDDDLIDSSGNEYSTNSAGAYKQESSSNEASSIIGSSIEKSYASSRSSSSSSSEETDIAKSSEKLAPKSSPFPSNRLLVFMVIMIVLVGIGLIAGLTFFLWEKMAIDPICRPDDPMCTVPSAPTPVPPNGGDPSTPLVKTDQELLNLFASVVGEAARSEFTSAGMAANWMLYEDPGKDLKIRSDQAWIQRYLLVYTYYATTFNRSTSWLSCNPATEGELELNDKDACKFAYPTELPGGKIIFDLVPSYRWLSAADECQWGGVACGKTVIDEIDVGKAAPGSNIAIKSTMKRLAVTSIVLADQFLKGSIVTELTELPMLQALDLSHNGLEGTLSEKFRSLETLRLQYNAIKGKIPPNLFSDQSVMKELNVGSNLMSGTIPNEVGLASQMTDLYLFNNKFTGRIPPLGNMPLINFQAQKNQFIGMMPFDYGFGGSWPDTLREWWVYDNQLTGSLSDNLGFITGLEDLRVNNNKLTGIIPESIQDLQRLFRLEVQSNSLTGTVPEGMGEIPVLRDVRLQFNDFEGVVPTSLCFLESMEVLEADCLAAADPQTDCLCCTACCNPELGQCQYY
jgi:hypothetical protein